MTRTGVLLMAYGSPRSMEEVAPYLADIRGGRPADGADAAVLAGLRERYAAIGLPSPLTRITQRQAGGLQQRLDDMHPGAFRVAVGMKHWQPRIADAVQELRAAQVDGIVGIALAPHYSAISIGGYELRVREALSDGMPFTMVESWHAEPGLISVISANLRDALGTWDFRDGSTRVFFSAHSLPERILDTGDPYVDQLKETARLVGAQLGIDDYEVTFQSQSSTGEAWLGPVLSDRLRVFGSQGGARAVVAPVGFVCDHLEILFDIDVEAAAVARSAGLELRRIASPNDDPRFLDVLTAVAVRAAGVPALPGP